MNTIKKKGWFLAAIVAVLALCAAPVLADDHEGKEAKSDGPAYRWVTTDHITPSMTEAFEGRHKAWVEAFTKAEAGNDWGWWTFQSGFEYLTGWAFDNFAELDEDSDKMIAEMVGEDTFKKLQEHTGAVVKRSSMIVKHNMEASYASESFDPANPGKFFHVGTYWIKPGTEKRFAEMAKKIKAAHEKAKSPHSYHIWNVVAGEGTFLVTSWGESAGEYYSRPGMGKILSEAYGEEGAQKLFAEWMDIAVDMSGKNYTFKPEMSYAPGMAKKDESK